MRKFIIVLAFILFLLPILSQAVVHTHIIIPESVAEEFTAKWDYDCPEWEIRFTLYLKNPDDTWTEIQEFTSKCDEAGAKNFEETFTYDVIPGQNYTFGLTAKNADEESDKAEATIYIPYPKPTTPGNFILLLGD